MSDNTEKAIVSRHDTAHGTVRSYTAGFCTSIVLTLAAYLLVVNKVFDGWGLVLALGGLAIAQLLAQLLFFLHLGRESKPHWNLTVLLFALLVVVGVVGGSLWIMKNLQYNHNHSHGLDPSQTNQFLVHDEGYDAND